MKPTMKPDLPRLNPFEFPGNTEFRFILLIVAVTGASLFIYADFYNSVIWDKKSDFSPGICALWMIGGSILTLAVAVTIYWWRPNWKIKHEGMRSLRDKSNSESMILYLDELRREVGLSRLPNFFWGALDHTSQGYVFGRWGYLCVYIPGGLAECFAGKLPKFRAIILHEFAHIHNGDVHRTELSFTMWQSFLITALPIFILTLLLSSWERRLGMSMRVLILFILIELIRNAVLRAREFYADLRASIWDSQSSALRLALEESVKPSANKLSFWQRIWLTHPDLSDRRRILDNTSPLFQMGFWDAFATGMGAMIPFTNFVALAGFTFVLVRPAWILGIFIFFVSALISATLIIYVIGAGTWRVAFASIAGGKSVRGINKLAIGLALGIVVGQQISFLGASKISSNPVVLLLWTCLLLIGMTSFFQWVALGAMTWLPIAARSQSPRKFYRLGLVIAGGILASLFLGMFVTLISWSSQASPQWNAQFSPHRLIAFNPFISLAIIGLWAYPMSSWFWRKRIEKTPVAQWLFLDSPSQPVTLSRQVQLKPTLALIVGLLGGLVGSLLVFIVIPLGGNIVNFVLALSILIQLLVAGFVAAVTRNLGSIHGLFAASVAACLMSISVFIQTNSNLVSALFLGTGIFNSGGLVAVPTVLIVSGIANWFRDSK